LTREHVGIFVQKLLDTVLGSYHDLARFAIKPIVVSAQPAVDAAAYRHAIAWGVLLVSPGHPTPYELLADVENQQLPERVAERILRDCPTLAARLWRPFNRILVVAEDKQHMHFTLQADQIYGADQTGSILDFWSQCALEASHTER
jgi:hypothetical protein